MKVNNVSTEFPAEETLRIFEFLIIVAGAIKFLIEQKAYDYEPAVMRDGITMERFPVLNQEFYDSIDFPGAPRYNEVAPEPEYDDIELTKFSCNIKIPSGLDEYPALIWKMHQFYFGVGHKSKTRVIGEVVRTYVDRGIFGSLQQYKWWEWF